MGSDGAASAGDGDKTRSQESEVAEALDGMLELLRACRLNLRQRSSMVMLRELEIRIGHLALALDWAADGETKKTVAALALARGLPLPAASGAELFNEDWTLSH